MQTSAKAIKFARRGAGGAYSRISLMNFTQGFHDMLGSVNHSTPLRHAVVTTVQKELLIGARGKLDAEISRSITQYAGKQAGGGAANSGEGLEALLDTRDFLKNTAFQLQYADEYPGAQLHYGVRLQKTANGYTNPGNTFLNQGSQEAGVTLRKRFMKNKLQVALRTDVREYRFNEEIGDKWRNTYSVLDVRWRLKRGQSLALRYTPSKMVRVEDAHQQTVTSLQRLSADAYLSKKIGRFAYQQSSSLSYQRNQYLQGGDFTVNRNIIFFSNQSLYLNKKLLFLNAQYNQALGGAHLLYFNTSFSADAGLSYTLFRSVMSSTALAYNRVQQWYEQVGVRQTVSGQISERFTMNLFVDAKKTLKTEQPLLFGPLRMEVNCQYSLKN